MLASNLGVWLVLLRILNIYFQELCTLAGIKSAHVLGYRPRLFPSWKLSVGTPGVFREAGRHHRSVGQCCVSWINVSLGKVRSVTATSSGIAFIWISYWQHAGVGCPVLSATPVRNLHLRMKMSWLEAFPQLSSHSSPAGNILNKVWFFSELEKKQEGQGSERERNCLTLYQKQLFLLEGHHFLLEVFQSQQWPQPSCCFLLGSYMPFFARKKQLRSSWSWSALGDQDCDQWGHVFECSECPG